GCWCRVHALRQSPSPCSPLFSSWEGSCHPGLVVAGVLSFAEEVTISAMPTGCRCGKHEAWFLAELTTMEASLSERPIEWTRTKSQTSPLIQPTDLHGGGAVVNRC